MTGSGPPGLSVGGGCLEVFDVEAARFQVALAGVLEAEGWTSRWPGARGKLAKKQALWDAAVIHPRNMAKPAQASC